MAHMSLTLSHAAHPPLDGRAHARQALPGPIRSAQRSLRCSPAQPYLFVREKNGGQSDWRIKAPTDRPRGILLEGLSDGRSLVLGLDRRWTFGARVTWGLEAVNGVLKGLTEHSNVYN